MKILLLIVLSQNLYADNYESTFNKGLGKQERITTIERYLKTIEPKMQQLNKSLEVKMKNYDAAIKKSFDSFKQDNFIPFRSSVEKRLSDLEERHKQNAEVTQGSSLEERMKKHEEQLTELKIRVEVMAGTLKSIQQLIRDDIKAKEKSGSP